MKVDSHIQLPISIIESFSEKKPVGGKNGKTNTADFVNVLIMDSKRRRQFAQTNTGANMAITRKK